MADLVPQDIRPLVPPVRWGHGEPITAKKLSEVVNATNRKTNGVPLPNQVRKNPPIAAAFAKFKIVSISGDYLSCNQYQSDGVTLGSSTLISVARPYLLQKQLTSWNGLTFTYSDAQSRSATDGTNTEPQVIVPAYVVGDQIYAFKVQGTGIKDSNGNAVLWVDWNLDARAWAKQQDALTQTQEDTAS